MNKKAGLTVVAVLIIVAIIAVAGYFIMDKINENKRDYKIETISEQKYFVVKTNGKYGVIDKSGSTIIDATYEAVKIPNPSRDIFVCYKNDKGMALNSNKEQLFTEYNSVEPIELNNVAYDLPYEKSVLKCEKNGKYGLIDFEGKKILDTTYDKIESFANVEGQIQIEQNEKIGIANIKGTIIVKPEYDEIIGDNYYSQENGNKSAGYIVGTKNEDGYKYGYINNKGKLKLKLEYNDISRATEINNDKTAYLIAAKNGQYGVYRNSKDIINNEYQAIEYDKSNNVFIIQKGSKYGVSNIKGDIIIPVENTSVQAKGQYIYVENENEESVYDAEGNKANIDFEKTIMNTSNENYKIVINSNDSSNYYGVIDKNNKELIKTEYLYIEYAFNNYFIVCGKNGKLGILDDSGKTMIDLKYDLVQKVDGKNIIQTLVADTNTTELYSVDMKKVCTMEKATVESKENYIKVSSNAELNYYNNEGTAVSSAKIFTDRNLFAKSEDGKWGYVDASGKTKIEFEYEKVTEFNDYGYASIKKDGKWGAINETGQIVIEPKYEIDESLGNVEFIGQYLKIENGFGDVYYTNDI